MGPVNDYIAKPRHRTNAGRGGQEFPGRSGAVRGMKGSVCMAYPPQTDDDLGLLTSTSMKLRSARRSFLPCP